MYETSSQPVEEARPFSAPELVTTLAALPGGRTSTHELYAALPTPDPDNRMLQSAHIHGRSRSSLLSVSNHIL
jgi:hypothetical protein